MLHFFFNSMCSAVYMYILLSIINIEWRKTILYLCSYFFSFIHIHSLASSLVQSVVPFSFLPFFIAPLASSLFTAYSFWFPSIVMRFSFDSIYFLLLSYNTNHAKVKVIAIFNMWWLKTWPRHSKMSKRNGKMKSLKKYAINVIAHVNIKGWLVHTIKDDV